MLKLRIYSICRLYCTSSQC